MTVTRQRVQSSRQAGAPRIRDTEIACLVRTVVQLHPGQGGQRLRLRLQRLALARPIPGAHRWLLAGPDRLAGPGWPDAFTPLDACPGGAASAGQAETGELCLLGQTRVIAPAVADAIPRWAEADWTVAGAPLLWRYHLYYWDWAWALGAETGPAGARDVFAAAWASWHAAVRSLSNDFTGGLP